MLAPEGDMPLVVAETPEIVAEISGTDSEAIPALSIEALETPESDIHSEAILLSVEELSGTPSDAASPEANADVEVGPIVSNADAVAPEYAEIVAKDLSKNREGGLSKLFDTKKKIFFGISATAISLGIVGSLFGLGILDGIGGSKANVTESPMVVAKATPDVQDAKTMALVPVTATGSDSGSGITSELPRATASGGTVPELTETGVIASVTTAVAMNGTGQVAVTPTLSYSGAAITVSGTGKIVPSMTGALTLTSTGGVLATATGSLGVTGTGKTVASTGAVTIPTTATTTSINTFRAPNIPVKKPKK